MSPTPSWPRDLLGAGQVEAAGPVVQQRRVGGPQGGGDEGVGLVPRRADRVEPVAPSAQPSRRVVEVAAGDLGVEEHVQAASGQRRARRERGVGLGAVLTRRRDRSDGVEQLRFGLVELLALRNRALLAHGTEITMVAQSGTDEPNGDDMTLTGTADELTADSVAPALRTALPGPNAAAIIARDEAVTSPSLTRVVPARRAPGARLRDRGRRRQPLPRLQRRDRRRRRRTRSSRRQRGHPCPGRRRRALLLERLLPARLRRRQRASRPLGADVRAGKALSGRSCRTRAPRRSRPRSSSPATTPGVRT